MARCLFNHGGFCLIIDQTYYFVNNLCWFLLWPTTNHTARCYYVSRVILRRHIATGFVSFFLLHTFLHITILRHSALTTLNNHQSYVTFLLPLQYLESIYCKAFSLVYHFLQSLFSIIHTIPFQHSQSPIWSCAKWPRFIERVTSGDVSSLSLSPLRSWLFSRFSDKQNAVIQCPQTSHQD